MGVIQELERFAARMPEPAVKHSVLMTAHVLRYPMMDILAKVPGGNLKERAKAIGVSRQTMYVWAHEKFRPAPDQAAIISGLTGIPVWQIRDLQEGGDDIGTEAVEAVAELESGGEAASSVHGRTERGTGTRRVVFAQNRSGSIRKVRGRTGD